MKTIPLVLIVAALVGATQAKDLPSSPGISHPIEPHFIGFNQNFMGQTDPWDDRLIAQLAKSEAATFRYPAGTVGTYWNWRSGRVDESLDPSEVMSWVKPHVRGGDRAGQGRYTIDNLKKAVDATGIVPVFMLGMTVHGLTEQIALLKYAESIGVPVRYLELGNEIIFEGAEPLLEKKFPDAETYGRVATEWIVALRQAFPSAKIAACGSFVASAKQSERRRTWNPRVLTTLKGTDIITTHLYAGEIVRTEKERAGLSEVQAQQALSAEERARRPRDFSAQGTAEIIGLAYSVWGRLLEMTVVPKDKQIWVTEWSTSGAGGGGDQWQTSLATAALLDAFLRSNVTLTGHHTMGSAFGRPGGPASQPTPGRTDPSAATRNPGNSDNVSDQLNAVGIILREFSRVTKGQTLATQLLYPDAPSIKLRSGRIYSAVTGWIFSGKDSSAVTGILINLGSEAVSVARGSLPKPVTKYRQLAGTPETNPGDVTTSEGALSSTVELQPYSITVVY